MERYFLYRQKLKNYLYSDEYHLDINQEYFEKLYFKTIEEISNLNSVFYERLFKIRKQYNLDKDIDDRLINIQNLIEYHNILLDQLNTINDKFKYSIKARRPRFEFDKIIKNSCEKLYYLTDIKLFKSNLIKYIENTIYSLLLGNNLLLRHVYIHEFSCNLFMTYELDLNKLLYMNELIPDLYNVTENEYIKFTLNFKPSEYPPSLEPFLYDLLIFIRNKKKPINKELIKNYYDLLIMLYKSKDVINDLYNIKVNILNL